MYYLFWSIFFLEQPTFPQLIQWSSTHVMTNTHHENYDDSLTDSTFFQDYSSCKYSDIPILLPWKKMIFLRSVTYWIAFSCLLIISQYGTMQIKCYLILCVHIRSILLLFLSTLPFPSELSPWCLCRRDQYLCSACCILFQTSHQLDRYWRLFWLKYSLLSLSHDAFAQTLSGAGCAPRGHCLTLLWYCSVSFD